MELSYVQGINHSHVSIFAEIEQFLLPDVVALMWENYGQSELYRLLLEIAPYLTYAADRRAV